MNDDLSETGAAIAETPEKFFGKYRGFVYNNVDPMMIGRIQAIVPDHGPFPTSWAMPCFAFAGRQMGVCAVPGVGAGVWIEFEQGDPDFPIWSGCFWGSVAEVPVLALQTQPPLSGFTVQTQRQNTLTISDLTGPTGGIFIKSASGAILAINETGITIQNGKGAEITMIGPTVTINSGALVVTK